MKTIELKRKSWHHWLANFGDKRIYETTNICEYTRCVLIGTFLFLLSVVVSSLSTGAVLFTIGNIFGWLFLGYEFHNVSVIVTSTFTCIVLMFFIIVGRAKLIHQVDKEPSFVRLAYRSWKEKYCARVELK